MFGKMEKSVYAVNVKDFGATGNGVTDDTNAICTARDVAVTSNKALYFPAGVYMIHSSIELWSNCEIYGEGSKSVIKKIPSITQAVTKPSDGFTLGQTTFAVEDASAYADKVGHACCVTLGWGNYDDGAYGTIDRIDGNNITIIPFPVDAIPGLEVNGKNRFNAYPEQVLLSTSFPVFCTYRYVSITDLTENSVHDVYIHDLTIDGNRRNEEPCPYSLSAIHLSGLTWENSVDKVRDVVNPNKNIRIENMGIYNSPSDGISIQSSKNVCVTNCIIENCGLNAVHFGVGTDIGSVVGCKLNADYCGYFDCVCVGSISLTGNHFEECLYGIGGIDQATNGLTVTGNTFRNCNVGACAGLTPYPERMSHLTSANYGYGYVSQATCGVSISNNSFYGITKSTLSVDGKTVTAIERTGVGISAIGGTSFVFNGNTFKDLDKAIEMGCTKYIRIVNNYIRDCNKALAMTPDVPSIVNTKCGTVTLDSVFTGNTVQAKATGASAQITIDYAKNMLATGNIVVGADASIETGDNAENVIIENNIVTSGT